MTRPLQIVLALMLLIPSRSLAQETSPLPSRAGRLADTSKPPLPIKAFVERSRLPAVRSIKAAFESPGIGLTFFAVSYGREQDWGVYQSATGLLYRDRIGWIEASRSGYTASEADSLERTIEWFPLRASDTPLMSRRLLDTLAKRAPWLSESYRGFLARNAATPVGVLRRLIRDGPRWNGVAQNERLDNPATSWADLTALAALSPEIAQLVLQRPDVRDNPVRVYAIARLPEYRGSQAMQFIIGGQFRTFAPQLLSDSSTSEHLLLELFCSMEGYSQDSAWMRALYEHPGTHRSATLLTLFASGFVTSMDELGRSRSAGGRLQQFGLKTIDDAKLALVRRVRTDTALPPLVFPRSASRAGTDWRLLRELYWIRGRDSVTERRVRETLALSRAPLPVLRELAESLRTDPEYGIARNLLVNTFAAKDQRILTVIARLDTAKVRELPALADSLLRKRSRQ